jgi:hypothetical protein
VSVRSSTDIKPGFVWSINGHEELENDCKFIY